MIGYHKNNSHTVLMRVYTLLEVTLGWVLFRAKDLYQTNIYFKNMFGVSGNTFWDEMTGFLLKEYWLIFALGFLFSTPIAKRCNELLAERKMGILGKGMTIAYPVAVAGLFLVCVSYLVRGGYNPFIYFNF